MSLSASELDKALFGSEKEKADVDNIEQPSVTAFLKQQGTWDAKFNKEQQEYLEALNKQEVAEKVFTWLTACCNKVTTGACWCQEAVHTCGKDRGDLQAKGRSSQ